MSSSIGRFEIRRELGRGAQSIVYLAWDPQLEREVAVKTLHFAAAERKQNAALLAEARSVSRLRHPGIVPVFEAGEEDGDLYLVFEYVPGESLAALMRRRGAIPAAEAVPMMVDVLTALAEAHAQGVIHRDLKPSNVLIDAAGRSRVMDFGIARHVDDPKARQGLSGTPGFIAPEYIERRELSPRNDVYAAGVLLLWMLAGRPVHRETDPAKLLELARSTAVTVPADGAPIDEQLAAIALRAAALDPQARYADANAFRLALQAWLQPPATTADPVTEDGQPAALDFLLRRMKHRGDFPALSESVAAINRIASSESETIGTLSALILRDFSLTNKLLRLVNSAHYRPAGGGQISTISRAIVVLGFDTVRNIAITVLLFEHLQNKANAAQLKEEFLRACLAGLFGRELAAHLRLRDGEQVYICTVFHNLGRLLCQFYFPEESEDIRRLMQQQGCKEEAAAQRVLGTGFEALGIALARHWGFPELIQDSMRHIEDGPVRRPATTEERLRALAACANEYCDAVALLPADERDKALQALSARFADAVPVGAQAARELMHAAAEEIEAFASTIKVSMANTRIGRQLRQLVDGAPAPATLTDTGLPVAALLEQSTPAQATEEGRKAADAQAVLSAGIQDISNTLVEDFKLNDVLRIILETMYRAMGFKRVLLCIRDPRTNAMTGRFGFGPGVAELARQVRFSLSAHPDNVFNAATAKGADILISDIDDPKIAAHVPDWYRKSVPSHTFVLFPLTIKGRPVAMIYADKERAGEIEISEQELALLRTLRNQAVLAIKQAG